MRSVRAIVPFVAIALALAVAGCSVGEQGHAHVEDDGDVPFELLDREVPPLVPSTAEAQSRPVSLCFLEDGSLVSVERRLPDPVGLVQIARSLADAPVQRARSLRTAVADRLVRDVTLRAGVARVDLRSSIDDVDDDEQLLVVAQLVCTLTARPGVGLVSFSLEGRPVDVPRPDGTLASSAVSRDDFAELLR